MDIGFCIESHTHCYGRMTSVLEPPTVTAALEDVLEHYGQTCSTTKSYAAQCDTYAHIGRFHFL